MAAWAPRPALSPGATIARWRQAWGWCSEIPRREILPHGIVITTVYPELTLLGTQLSSLRAASRVLHRI